MMVLVDGFIFKRVFRNLNENVSIASVPFLWNPHTSHPYVRTGSIFDLNKWIAIFGGKTPRWFNFFSMEKTVFLALLHKCSRFVSATCLEHLDDKSTFPQVMAWCRQATSHYQKLCWPWLMSPFGIIKTRHHKSMCMVWVNQPLV